jgi:hypothetical protein
MHKKIVTLMHNRTLYIIYMPGIVYIFVEWLGEAKFISAKRMPTKVAHRSKAAPNRSPHTVILANAWTHNKGVISFVKHLPC